MPTGMQIGGRQQQGAAAWAAACVAACWQARDARGRWRPQRDLQAQLLATGSTPAVAEATALAARRVGEHLAGLWA